MRFERKYNNQPRNATFEVRTDLGLHESSVAIRALGVHTATYRLDPAERTKSAQLAMEFKGLEITEPDENPQGYKYIDAQTRLTTPKAQLLGVSLQEFINDTGTALAGLMLGNRPEECNTRAMETDLAKNMLGQLRQEFDGKLIPAEVQAAGFN